MLSCKQGSCKGPDMCEAVPVSEQLLRIKQNINIQLFFLSLLIQVWLLKCVWGGLDLQPGQHWSVVYMHEVALKEQFTKNM